MIQKGQSIRPGKQAGTSQDAREPYHERNKRATLSSVYCPRAGHNENDCWKNQHAVSICSYWSRRVHDDTECWAKQREERERDVQSYQ